MICVVRCAGCGRVLVTCEKGFITVNHAQPRVMSVLRKVVDEHFRECVMAGEQAVTWENDEPAGMHFRISV